MNQLTSVGFEVSEINIFKFLTGILLLLITGCDEEENGPMVGSISFQIEENDFIFTQVEATLFTADDILTMGEALSINTESSGNSLSMSISDPEVIAQGKYDINTGAGFEFTVSENGSPPTTWRISGFTATLTIDVIELDRDNQTVTGVFGGTVEKIITGTSAETALIKEGQFYQLSYTFALE